MKKILFLLGLLLVASNAHAQGATASSFLAWDQQAPDLATAQQYTYKYYPDNTSNGTTLPNPICSAITGQTTTFTCQVPMPAFTPGNHSLVMTTGNMAGESLPSSPLSFTFVVIPSVPTNLRIISK